MKLFHASGACSTAPYIVINELGLNCEIVKVNFADRTELLKHNSQGKVPVLVLDNGHALTECAAIMTYLCDQKPEAGLMPKLGTWERYKTIEGTNFVATELHKSLGALFAKDMPDTVKAFQTTLCEKKLDWLNTFLGTNQFMAANQYTIADTYCYIIVGWTKWLGFDMSKYPNVMGYCERIGTRPAIMKTMAADTTK